MANLDSSTDFWRQLRMTFQMTRRELRPCPDGKRCAGAPYDDEYGSWHGGCGWCRGRGQYTHRESYHAGWLMHNVVQALWAERAYGTGFQDGYSAGVTDARS